MVEREFDVVIYYLSNKCNLCFSISVGLNQKIDFLQINGTKPTLNWMKQIPTHEKSHAHGICDIIDLNMCELCLSFYLDEFNICNYYMCYDWIVI